ncbi:MAG: NTP transferase domain-containing protein [Candidatus Aenigmarchaeota archaeon]|nr:NTP transferase domain-containing protein [Candidatus Aenigmarchaeota archaeon]
MQAVILAAGKGTRLGSLTEKTPKVLLPIGNKPLLGHAIYALSENNIRDISLVVNYRREDIEKYFGDGSRFNVDLSYLHQKNPAGGTADALSYAKGKIDSGFVLLYADVIFHPYFSVVKRLKENCRDCDGLIACKEVKNPQEFGILELENNRIVRIHEKSPNPPSNLGNLGMYYLTPEIFDAIERTPLSKRGERELTDSIQILIDEGSLFRPLIVKEQWVDIGRIEDYKRAQEFFKSKNG